MKILITGGAGFIGVNFVRHLLKRINGDKLVVFDKLTYAGRKENLHDVMKKITFVIGDIANDEEVKRVMKDTETVINFAAETHVDRSIADPQNFVRTNLFGTYVLLEHARKSDVTRFLHISTDEVYGSAEKGSVKETDSLNPSSPYSASKAGADMLAKSYHTTYGLPILIARSTNNFGPFQYPEKLIPFFVVRALQDKTLPLYGDGMHVRDWIYVEDNCEALEMILQKGKKGETYNIGAGNLKTNLEVARFLLSELGKPENLITFVQDRLGHDRRYSLDTTKIMKLGWRPRSEFEHAMRRTINWYRSNAWWWKPLLSDS